MMSRNKEKTTLACKSTSTRLLGYYRTEGNSYFLLEILSTNTFSTKHTTDSGAHPTSQPMSKAAPFTRVKRPEREVEPSPPPRAQIECRYTSSPRAFSRRSQGNYIYLSCSTFHYFSLQQTRQTKLFPKLKKYFF